MFIGNLNLANFEIVTIYIYGSAWVAIDMTRGNNVFRDWILEFEIREPEKDTK